MNGFDGGGNDGGQLDRLFAEFDPALHDARDIEQVVHQTDQVLYLAFGYPAALFHGLSIRAGDLQDLKGVAYGGQWVPEFVGQHRQEFILAAIGIGQSALRFDQFLMLLVRCQIGHYQA